MLDIAKVDISEDEILEFDKELLDILLYDRTTNHNIIWATDDYQEKGEGFAATDNIIISNITGKMFSAIIRPRSVKTSKQQRLRARSKAEVFTPSWLCNKQNNLLDETFFGRKSVFNKESEEGWIVVQKKVSFPEGKNWKDYILNPLLEISCGEAPYLVSRYDSTTGKGIELIKRIGLLDRKFRIISENAAIDEEWLEWSIKAIEHTYGFELQGDNLLIARENVLFTFLDYYYQRHNSLPNKKLIRRIATIISWNLWQMDGLKLVVPFSCHNTIAVEQQFNFGGDNISSLREKILPCPGCKGGKEYSHNGIYCNIKDWDSGIIDSFINISTNRYGKI